LYGLKQSPRAWYTRIEAYENLYQIVVEGKLLIIVLYVDDLILTSDENLIKYWKDDFARKFEMKYMALMHYFLGLEVQKGDGELFISQGKYANKILRKLCMESRKHMDTPLASSWRKEDSTSGEEVEATIYRQLVGSLLYLVNIRPEMCYGVNQLSQAMVKPTKFY